MASTDYLAGFHTGYQAAIEHARALPGVGLSESHYVLLSDAGNRTRHAEAALAASGLADEEVAEEVPETPAKGTAKSKAKAVPETPAEEAEEAEEASASDEAATNEDAE